jgi:hypothetical protein
MGTVAKGSYATQRAAVHCSSAPRRSPHHHNRNLAAPPAISSKSALHFSSIRSAGSAISGVHVPHARPAPAARKSRRHANLSVKVQHISVICMLYLRYVEAHVRERADSVLLALCLQAGPTNPHPEGDDDEAKDSPPAKKPSKRNQRHDQLDSHPTLTCQQARLSWS